MQIEAIRFTNAAQNIAEILTTEGTVVSVPWPCTTWHQPFIAAWIAAGNIPAAWPSLTEARAVRRSQAAALYQSRLAAGCSFGGSVYQIDEASQNRLTALGASAGLMLQGAIAEESFEVIATDNSITTLSPADMVALTQAARGIVTACRLRLRALKTAIDDAADLEALDLIDIETGWPG